MWVLMGLYLSDGWTSSGWLPSGRCHVEYSHCLRTWCHPRAKWIKNCSDIYMALCPDVILGPRVIGVSTQYLLEAAALSSSSPTPSGSVAKTL